MSPFTKLYRRYIARLRQPLAPVAPTPAAAKPLPYTRLSLSDWCASQERVAYVAELLRAPLFLELVGMLANIRPIRPRSLDATTAAMLLGQQLGHDAVIASLLAAGTSTPSLPPQPEPDYAPENVMAAWENVSENES